MNSSVLLHKKQICHLCHDERNSSEAPKLGRATAQPIFALVKDQTVQGWLLAPGKVFLTAAIS